MYRVDIYCTLDTHSNAFKHYNGRCMVYTRDIPIWQRILETMCISQEMIEWHIQIVYIGASMVFCLTSFAPNLFANTTLSTQKLSTYLTCKT